MDLTSEAIVRRYSRIRPGYRLVWYDNVAIPVYVIKLRALVLETKPLAAVDEFLLAGIEAGLSELEELSGFLGLSERLVKKLVRRLISSDLVTVANLNHSRVTLSLTAVGEKVLQNAQEIVTEEEEITVVIDGLTRQIEDARIGSNFGSYAIWSDVAKAGIRELPSNPRTQPELEDFAEDLKRKWNNDADRDCSLVDVLKIVRVDRLFRDDVLLLGFSGIDSDASISALAVAGHLSPAHTEAFQRIDEKSLAPITALQGRSLEEFAQENLPSEVFQMLADHGFSEGSSLDTANSDARLTALEAKLQATSSVIERSSLKEELLSEKEKQAELLARTESLPVRSISVFEHPALLERALEFAKVRLLIISPWIRGAIVDSAFTKRLQNALDRQVEVFIGYGLDGIDEPPQCETDRAAIRRLRELSSKYSNFSFRRLGNTHAKVLAVDSDFSVITSFNWLSFKGDPLRRFRDERGVYIAIPEFIDSVFLDYRSLEVGGRGDAL